VDNVPSPFSCQTVFDAVYNGLLTQGSVLETGLVGCAFGKFGQAAQPGMVTASQCVVTGRKKLPECLKQFNLEFLEAAKMAGFIGPTAG